MVNMSKLVRVSEEVHARLSAYADSRPLGLAVEMLLDHRDVHAEEHARPKFEANPSGGLPVAAPWPQPAPKKSGHTFTPQPANALRCQECGQAKHKHR